MKHRIMNIDNLVKFSTYAKKIDRSVTRIEQMVAEGKLEEIRIDGVKFIKLK